MCVCVCVCVCVPECKRVYMCVCPSKHNLVIYIVVSRHRTTCTFIKY